MKKGLLPVLMILVFSYSACKKGNKDSAAPDNGCISRVQATYANDLLAAPTLDSIDALFQKDNLPLTGLQFYLYQSITYPDSAGLRKDTAYANLFVNGLPAFYVWREFPFRSGVLQPADPWNSGYPGFPTNHNDTTGHQTLPDLRGAFLRLTANYYTSSFPLTHPTFGDSCLTATLGYVDAANLSGSTYMPQHLLVKVWKVTTTYTPEPVVFVVDSSGGASLMPTFSINF